MERMAGCEDDVERRKGCDDYVGRMGECMDGVERMRDVYIPAAKQACSLEDAYMYVAS